MKNHRTFSVNASAITLDKLDECREHLLVKYQLQTTQNNMINYAIQNMDIERFCHDMDMKAPKKFTLMRNSLQD